MKRKITNLEKKLIENGWYLTMKRYMGKRSEKTCSYAYHKTSDIRNNGKTYEQVIELDQKRSQIVNFGILNVQINYLDSQELDFIRFLFLELRHFVERIEQENASVVDTILETSKTLGEIASGFVPNNELDERQELPQMTMEQFDELCQELERNEK